MSAGFIMMKIRGSLTSYILDSIAYVLHHQHVARVSSGTLAIKDLYP